MLLCTGIYLALLTHRLSTCINVSAVQRRHIRNDANGMVGLPGIIH